MTHAIAVQAQGSIKTSARDLDYIQAQGWRDTHRIPASAVEGVEVAFDSIATGTVSTYQGARVEIESLARLIVGLGPQATLQRGFAMARDTDDRPITSREIAQQNQEFIV
jgi:exodeoxyribonuclease VII large subunit